LMIIYFFLFSEMFSSHWIQDIQGRNEKKYGHNISR